MPIVVRLDVMLALRKMRSRELAQRIDLSEVNLSLLKTGRVKGIRFETLEKICAALTCQPGDLLVYEPSDHVAASGPSDHGAPDDGAGDA